jgi:superfamily I DNA/RNA helicase
VVEEESLPSALNKLAAIAPVSGLTASRKWIEAIAAEAGAPLSTTESVLTDAETGQNLGQDLQQVNSKLGVATPNTPESADLQTQKTNLVGKIEQVARESKAPSAVLSSAATASTTQRRSTIAERFHLTPEQQEVSETMGKVVVAAGAGSGKTTTLVATIAGLVENKGYAPEQIMTCSFTRAASAELALKLERDGKVSGVVSGTTHHIARDIIIRNRPTWVNAMRNQRGADKCFKVALKQVEMSVEGFKQQMEDQKAVIRRIENISGWRGKDILRSFHEQASKGRPLSPKQIAVIQKFEGGGGYRRWAAATAQDWLKLAAPPPLTPMGEPKDPDDDDTTDEEDVPKPDAKDEGKWSKYWQAPVGEWFNIGKKITNEKGEKLGERAALLAVDNFKNSGITVAQARAESGDTPVVALYGAYEWLKLNDPVHGPAMDFTDQLAVALDILKTDPQALASEQSRYKIIMVDEAQDLNQIQFEMFNLIGKNADLLSFIGDDKQSIYQFRGARPGNYIDLSKKEGYQTKLMTTNFRSGSEIVQAANKLIAHNEDRQIPMTCKAYESRGTGAISALSPATHEDAANLVAQQIKDGVDAGESPTDFGILVRNNAESDAYTLSLIVRGIPYRCLKQGQGGYFAKPVVRALTAWTRLAIGGTTAEMNEAVVTAHRTPGFGMDEMFGANLGRMAKGQNYYDYIAGGGAVYSGTAAWLNKKIELYVDAIRTIKVLGHGDSAALVHAILDLKGPKGSFVDALMKMVDEDDVVEEEGGEGGEEAIRQAALAPVRPLMLMAENFSDPENMLAFIAKMKAANEKVEKKSPQDKDDWKEPAVLVGTVHGWKGLETKHVYVSMAGGVFPNFRSDKEAEKQELAGVPVTAYDEERRLAYVAITRGKDTTTIMSPQRSYLGKPSGSSMFINEACIPMGGEAGEAGVGLSEYDDDGDDAIHLGEPGKSASGHRASKFADDLVSNMETTEPNLITDMII